MLPHPRALPRLLPRGLGGAHRRRVREGSQHAGDVSQRRLVRAPLGERPRRLPLEVDDQEAASIGSDDLSQVIVSVGARQRATVGAAAYVVTKGSSGSTSASAG